MVLMAVLSRPAAAKCNRTFWSVRGSANEQAQKADDSKDLQTSTRGLPSVEIIRFLSSCKAALLPALCPMAKSNIWLVAYVSLILYRDKVWNRMLGFCAKSTGETRYVGAAAKTVRGASANKGLKLTQKDAHEASVNET